MPTNLTSAPSSAHGRMRRWWAVAFAAHVLLISASTATAQTATTVEVYASGLLNPKGMAFGTDGALYVAESGKPGQVNVPLPVNFGGTGPIGTNARISRIAPGAQRQDFAVGLPNVGLYGGIEMLGASGMAVLDGAVYELAAGHMTVSPTLSRLDPDGRLRPIADIGAFNRANKVPDDNGDAVPMGNPFDLVALRGKLYVTDGNYNRILEVTTDGKVSILVTFSGDPTTVGATAGQDGNLYVAQFGLAPYTPGSGRIDRVALDGTVTLGVVKNLTTPIDVAFAPDGAMFVLQFASEFNSQRLRYVPFGGEVRRVNPDGTTTPVVTGLMFPTSLTFGPDGALYVSNYGNESNDGQGQVLRVAVGDLPATGPAVVMPDESKSYALAQPTPLAQVPAAAQIAGAISIDEPAEPTQWGFEPKTFSVQAGQAVTFTNQGKIAHTATQSQGAFDTGFLKGGESRTVTFDTPGAFAYFCQPHPWMQATIVVLGEARPVSAQATAPLASIPEEREAPPTIGAGRAIVFVGALLALVFGLGLFGRRPRARR